MNRGGLVLLLHPLLMGGKEPNVPEYKGGYIYEPFIGIVHEPLIGSGCRADKIQDLALSTISKRRLGPLEDLLTPLPVCNI